MTSYLRDRSEFIGKGAFPGYLYMVDFFPGAIYEPAAVGWVYGELFHLQQPARVLEVLDEYEHFLPDDPVESLFLRKEVTIRLAEADLPAWAYIYNRSTESLPLIESGDFLAYLAKNI